MQDTIIALRKEWENGKWEPRYKGLFAESGLVISKEPVEYYWNNVLVVSRYAAEISSLIFELRDRLKGYIDGFNDYEFCSRIGKAVISCIKEKDDQLTALFDTILSEAFEILQEWDACLNFGFRSNRSNEPAQGLSTDMKKVDIDFVLSQKPGFLKIDDGDYGLRVDLIVKVRNRIRKYSGEVSKQNMLELLSKLETFQNGTLNEKYTSWLINGFNGLQIELCVERDYSCFLKLEDHHFCDDEYSNVIHTFDLNSTHIEYLISSIKKGINSIDWSQYGKRAFYFFHFPEAEAIVPQTVAETEQYISQFTTGHRIEKVFFSIGDYFSPKMDGINSHHDAKGRFPNGVLLAFDHGYLQMYSYFGDTIVLEFFPKEETQFEYVFSEVMGRWDPRNAQYDDTMGPITDAICEGVIEDVKVINTNEYSRTSAAERWGKTADWIQESYQEPNTVLLRLSNSLELSIAAYTEYCYLDIQSLEMSEDHKG